jgi:hypothetical protein
MMYSQVDWNAWRVDWNAFAGLLRVAGDVLDNGINTQVAREFFRKSLREPREKGFYTHVNGWTLKRGPWPKIASHDFSLLAADAAADSLVQVVELLPHNWPAGLDSALSGYLAGYSSRYPGHVLTAAKALALYACDELAACLAQGALGSPRALTAAHVGRLASAFGKAADIRPKDAEERVNFPFPEVVRQVALQSPAVLAQALPELEALNAHITEWPTIHWDQRRARVRLGALCADIRGKSA